MSDFKLDSPNINLINLYRYVLFLKVMQDNRTKSWIAPVLSDGTMTDGMFIGGIMLPSGPIGLLLPTTFWELAQQLGVSKLEKAPALQNTDIKETIRQLLNWISYAHKAMHLPSKSFTDFLASMSKMREPGNPAKYSKKP
jgi:hypothetical protein